METAGAATTEVKKVDEKEFETVIAGDKTVLVDFFATWCGPCKILGPKLDEMVKDYPDVVFIKVDVDESESLSEKYKVTAMPTIIIFKKGEEVGRIVGTQVDSIKKLLDEKK